MPEDNYAYEFIAVNWTPCTDQGICDYCATRPATVAYGNDYQGVLLALCNECSGTDPAAR